MILRMILTLVTLSFIVLAILPKGKGENSPECKILSCELGYAEGCVTRAEAAETLEACKEEPCECIASPYDACYKGHGTCSKTADGCGWEPSKDLDNCIKMVDAAEAIRKHNNITE